MHAVVTQIEAAERLGAILTVGLALMAFVAALTALRIQQRLRSLTKDLHRRAREEKALRRAAEALSAPRTIDDVLVEIASSALLATGADGAFVERIDPSTNTLRIVSAAGEYAPLLHGEGPSRGPTRNGRSPAGHTAEQAGPEHGLPAEVVERCDGCDIVVVPLSAAGEASAHSTSCASPTAGLSIAARSPASGSSATWRRSRSATPAHSPNPKRRVTTSSASWRAARVWSAASVTI